MRVHPGTLAAVFFLSLCSSCSRDAGDHLKRLAILPPEILIDDPASQWLGTALPLVWEEDLSAAPGLVVNVVKDPSGAYQFGATMVLRTIVENRAGQLSLQGTITDTATQRNREIFTLQSDSRNGVLPVANAFAKRVDEHATKFSTKNERAFEIFTRALQSPNAPGRIQALSDAISIDAGFGLSYVLLAETAAQTNPQSLPDWLARGGEHANSFTALDRAKFQALAAQAMHAPLVQQETAFRTLLQLAPNNLDALAGIGAIHFLQGDAVNGERMLSRALEVSPGNLNVLRQLASGLLETRQFAQAEKVLTGLDNNQAILSALATCVLLEGDLRRANAISDRFTQSLQPAVQDIYRATWLALTGHTADAIALLDGRSFADANLRSVVIGQLVIWHLMQKDFAGAQQTFASHAGPPGAFTPQAQLLSRADASSEQWQEIVQSSPLNSEQKESVLAYGLFLAGHYDQASELWQHAVDRSGGVDLRARAMLAASLDHGGHSQAARKIRVEPFVPEFGDLYSAISFAEMRRLLNLQVH